MKKGLIIGVVVILVLGVGSFFLFSGENSNLGDINSSVGDGIEELPLGDNLGAQPSPEESVAVEWDNTLGGDCITAKVCLNKSSKGGLFNSVSETAEDRSISPEGTEWAAGPCESAISFEVLFQAANEKYGENLVSDAGYCLHLIEDDLYFDFEFLTWRGENYSYIRVPFIAK